jgi:hypothetical protein
MIDDKDPRVAEIVSRLIESAPVAPPLPDALTMSSSPRRPARRVAGAVVAFVLLIVGVALISVLATGTSRDTDRPTQSANSVSVRSATVKLGNGFRLVDEVVVRDRTGERIGMGVVIRGPNGRCVVASAIEPTGSRPSVGPWTSTGDQGWRRELAGREALTVKCASPAAARSIRQRIELSGE